MAVRYLADRPTVRHTGVMANPVVPTVPPAPPSDLALIRRPCEPFTDWISRAVDYHLTREPLAEWYRR